MERTTCYKLCYALGVSQAELVYNFGVEHRVACTFGVFNPGPSARRFRALAALYYHIMRNYYAYADVKGFRVGVEEFYSQFSVTSDYDPVHERGDRPLLEYVQEVVWEHNILAKDAYKDLQIAIPEDVFREVTALPFLTQQSAAQVAFLMSKTNHAYGLYFFGNDLLNVSLGSMLQDDMALRDRLSLCFGARMPSMYDNSALSAEVSKYLADAFIRVQNISNLGNVKVLDEGDNSWNLRQFTARCRKLGQSYATIHSMSELSNGDVCVTANAGLSYVVAPTEPAVNFALLLPVESRYYKQCRRRVYSNIYLVSQR